MAKNVLINGIVYPSVPSVSIPQSDGAGAAKFVDTDSGDANASDIAAGKKAWVKGTEVTGSAVYPNVSQDSETKVLTIS